MSARSSRLMHALEAEAPAEKAKELGNVSHMAHA